MLVALLAVPSLSFSQDVASSYPGALSGGRAAVTNGPTTYGTLSNTYLALTAWDAHPIDSTTTYDFVNSVAGQGISRTGGSAFFKLPVQLPNGALVSGVEFNYCDIGALSLSASWFQQRKGNTPVVTGLFSSTGTPGCVIQTATLPSPETIDNTGNSYNIELSMGASTDILFLSARVIYRLQVSPAPAVATFPNDVPTGHAFFRFVEALAAAGITAGVGPGTYGVDDPVTRGQMAVFLSIALGLHFPN
jgi:hypothetical protein